MPTASTRNRWCVHGSHCYHLPGRRTPASWPMCPLKRAVPISTCKTLPPERASGLPVSRETSLLNPRPTPLLQHSSTGEAVNLLLVPLTRVGGQVCQVGMCRLPMLHNIMNLITHSTPVRHSDAPPFIHQIELLDTKYTQVMANQRGHISLISRSGRVLL